jgi:Flp pilus assembly protein TadD
MSQINQPTQQRRSRSTPLFVVGNSVLALLLCGGVGFSIYASGRLPGVRFGYTDNHRRLLDTGRRGELIPKLRTAASIDFDDASAQLQLLSTANAANDLDSKAEALRGLLNHTPDDAELHGELAGVLLTTGALDKALVHSRYAIKLDPSVAWLHTTYGAVMLAMGRNREAAVSYRKALRLNPKSEPAKRALAYPLRNF